MKTENKLIKKRLKHPLKISTVLHASLMLFYDDNYSENDNICSRHLSPCEGTLWISGKDTSGNIFHQPFGFVLPSHLLLWYIISFSLYLCYDMVDLIIISCPPTCLSFLITSYAQEATFPPRIYFREYP